MSLMTVVCQGWLFPELAPSIEDVAMLDDRDQRTGYQWLRSVAAYCEWRAGECWRNLSLPHHRASAQRWEYLRAARLLQTLFYKTAGPELVLRSEMPVVQEPIEAGLAKSPRSVLVNELMLTNPELDDPRILSTFTKAKLAHLIIEARGRLRSERQA